MLEVIVYAATILGAHRLMVRAGCFSQPVLYPDLDHPLRYWWARRVAQDLP